MHEITTDIPQNLAFIETLILFAVFFVLSEVLKPKPKIENQRPAGLGDFKFPTATEGRPVPVVWGTVKQEGPNVIWYGALRQEPITEKVKTGVFSSKRITKGFRYYLGVQMAICRGGSTPVGELLRIWVGEDEVWSGSVSSTDTAITISEPEFFGGDDLGNGGLIGDARFFSGSMAQPSSSYLLDHQSVGGAVPAYRGTCYVLLEDFYLGNSTNIKAWAFEVRRIPNGLGLGTPGVNGGNDANPMNVIYELLTNTEWGLGLPAADIDVADFTTAALVLATEGNGFSFILDGEMEAGELLREIERQIDGVIYVDRSTGKYKCNLARGGYVLGDQQALDASTIVQVENFSRGSWADTTNNVLVKFSNRSLDYKETFAPAQDMANVRLQGNKVVSAEKHYPGVKNAALANNIAWRDLRLLSYPLARADVIVDRTLFNHNPGNVVRWSDADLDITDLPMRITKIDLGLLAEGKIRVTLVQDIFVWDTGLFVAPAATQWEPPAQGVVAIPTADSLVFEAPRAFISRADGGGVLDRIWCAARWQGDAAVDIEIHTRPNAGTYTLGGDVSGFAVAGELAAAMTAAGTQGSISMTLDTDGDSLGRLLNAMEAEVSESDCGQRLANLVLVGNEFFAFRNVAVSGSQLVLTNGYRGMLDSAPAAHDAADRAWILLGNLTDRTFTPGSDQDIKLLPRSGTETLPEGDATAIDIALNNRGRRPYPPVALQVNGSLYPTSTITLDTSGAGGPGSGLDDRGVTISYTRRDFRTLDETAALLNEDGLPDDFPAAAGTEYFVEVQDVSGTPTVLYSTPWTNGNEIKVSRTEILRATSGVLPTRLKFGVWTRHTYDGVVYQATQGLEWEVDVSSALLSGDTNWGNLAQNVASSALSAPSTATYTLNIGTALAAGAVQVNVNSAGWVTVIAAGNTTGTFGATAADNIQIRHTQSGSTSSETFCELVVAGSSIAYAVLTY